MPKNYTIQQWISEGVFGDRYAFGGGKLSLVSGSNRIVSVIDISSCDAASSSDAIDVVIRTQQRLKESPIDSLMLIKGDGRELGSERCDSIHTIWWDGYTSELDVLVHLLIEERHFPRKSSALASGFRFAAMELDLVSTLLKRNWDGSSSMAVRIAEEAWKAEMSRMEYTSAFSADMRVEELWKCGLATTLQSGGVVVSPFVSTDQIRRQIWLGQVKDLWPLLEEMRQWVMKVVIESTRIPAEVRAIAHDKWSKEAPEFKELYFTLQVVGDPLKRLTQWMLQTRNLIAHGTELPPSQIKFGQEKFNEARRALP